MGIKTIMAHLELGKSNQVLLDIVGGLAERTGAEVIGVAVCQPIQIFYDETYVSGEIFAEDRAEIRRQLEAAEKQFRDVLQRRARMLGWRTEVNYAPLCDFIAEQARAADLVVTGTDVGGSVFDSTRRVNIADLVMQAGRPVLIVPGNQKALNLDHVLLAWKGSRESRLAAAEALPLLKLAAKVTVARIVPPARLEEEKGPVEDVVAWLGRHGIKAEAKLAAATDSDAAGVAELARQAGADLIVAGAYGHSRAREWALGGVTQDFLLDPDRCVLVAH